MLKTKHFFPFIKMIRALDIKDELKEIFRKTRGKSASELEQLDDEEGIDYVFLFVEKLPNAEKEVMEFLSVYTEKTREEVGDMELDEVFGVLKEVVTDEKFLGFFKQAVN